MRRGSIKHLPEWTRAEGNSTGDSFCQFAYDNFYGPGSRWIRRTVLTREGYLVVADEYRAGDALGASYNAGPVWHLALGDEEHPTEPTSQTENWFTAPAFAHAWWQKEKIGVLLKIHQDGEMRFGKIRQRHSQDTDPNVTCFGWRPIKSWQTEHFLSVLTPQTEDVSPASLTTTMSDDGACELVAPDTKVRITADSTWEVSRTN